MRGPGDSQCGRYDTCPRLADYKRHFGFVSMSGFINSSPLAERLEVERKNRKERKNSMLGELMLNLFFGAIGLCVVLAIASEVAVMLALAWQNIKDILDL